MWQIIRETVAIAVPAVLMLIATTIIVAGLVTHIQFSRPYMEMKKEARRKMRAIRKKRKLGG